MLAVTTVVLTIFTALLLGVLAGWAVLQAIFYAFHRGSNLQPAKAPATQAVTVSHS
jgi:MFS superfamily sulfate permease-like transporter